MQRLLMLVLLVCAGCGGQGQPAAAPQSSQASAAEEPRSTGALVVDGVTGRGAVRAGQRARETIERVSKQENQNLEEAMGK